MKARALFVIAAIAMAAGVGWQLGRRHTLRHPYFGSEMLDCGKEIQP